MSNTVALASLLVAAAACVTDLRSQRIPNVLTFGGALAAAAFHALSSGPEGLQTAGAGWITGALVFMPLFLLGGMGAGDVKLIAALGAWLGPRDAFMLAVLAFLAGGVLALAVSLWTGYLKTAVGNIKMILRYWLAAGIRPVPGLTLDDSRGPRLAYALPIFVGMVVTLWIR